MKRRLFVHICADGESNKRTHVVPIRCVSTCTIAWTLENANITITEIVSGMISVSAKNTASSRCIVGQPRVVHTGDTKEPTQTKCSNERSFNNGKSSIDKPRHLHYMGTRHELKFLSYRQTRLIENSRKF